MPGKRNQKTSKPLPIGMKEPIRKSLRDYFNENLLISERRTFLHRLMFVGEHNFDPGDTQIEELFNKIVKEINSKTAGDKLYGFLLYYPKYLCVLAEGTEETFMAFLSKLYPKGVIHEKFKVFKLLSETHHIAHNFFSFWVCLSSSPPQLLSLLNVDPSQTRAVIIAVIKKLYNLAEDLAANHNRETILSPAQMTDIAHYRIVFCLPDNETLEFLVKSEDVRDLQFYVLDQYSYLYLKINDRIFPSPCAFVSGKELQPPTDPIEDIPSDVRTGSLVYERK